MARGMNKVTAIGFIERHPEMRHTAGGQPVTSFSICVSRRWTANSGDSRESAEWFNVVAWGALAMAANQRLEKGQRVYVQGHLQTRSWNDLDGQRSMRTEIVADTLISMETKPTSLDGGSADDGDQMPLCLNRVMVIGNLGRDPEMRYTPEGQAVTSFSVAATRRWITADGQRRDATEWFNVISWGSLAEICNEFLSKGRRVYVEGELRTRARKKPGGRRHFRTELVASEMIILGPRRGLDGVEDTPNVVRNDSPFQQSSRLLGGG